MNRSTVHKSQNRSRLLQPGYLSGKSQPKSTTARKTASVNNEGKKVFSRKKAVTTGTKSMESRAAFSNMTNSPEVNGAVVRTKNKSPSAISKTKLNNEASSENENNYKPQDSFTLKTPRYVNSFDKENEEKSASPALKSKPVGLKNILQLNSDQRENNLDVCLGVRRLDFSKSSNPMGVIHQEFKMGSNTTVTTSVKKTNSKASENFEFCNDSKKENLNFNGDQNDIEFEADPNSLNCILNEGGMTQKMVMDLRLPNQTKDGRASEVINNMRVFADGRPSGCMRVPINRPSTAGPRRVRNTADGRISSAGKPAVRSSSVYKTSTVRSSLYNSSRNNSLAPSTLNRPAHTRFSSHTNSKSAVRTSTYTSYTRSATASSVQFRKPSISSNARKPPVGNEATKKPCLSSKKLHSSKIEKNASVTQSSRKAVNWADERNDVAEKALVEDSPNLKFSPSSSISRVISTTPRSILKDKAKRKTKKGTPMKTNEHESAEFDGEIEVVTPAVLNEEEPSVSGVDVIDSGEKSERIEMAANNTTNSRTTPSIKIDRVLMELKKGMTSAKRRSLQTEYETVIQMIQRAAPTAVMETLHENVECGVTDEKVENCEGDEKVEKHEEEEEKVEEKSQQINRITEEKNEPKFLNDDEEERKNAEKLENKIKSLKLEVEEIRSCSKQRELQRSLMGFPTMTPLKPIHYSQQSSNHKLPTNAYASLSKPPVSQSNYSALLQKLHLSEQARLVAESKLRREVSISASPILTAKTSQQMQMMMESQPQETMNMGGKPLMKKLFDSLSTSDSSQNSTPSKPKFTATKQQTPTNNRAMLTESKSVFKSLQQEEVPAPSLFSPIRYGLDSTLSDNDLSSKGTWSDQLSQYKVVTTPTTQATMPGAPSLNRLDAIISQQQKLNSRLPPPSPLPATPDVKQALSSSFRNHNKLSPPRSNKVFDDRSYTELAESSPLMKFHPASDQTSAAASSDSNLIFPAAQRFTVHTPHALRVYRQRLQEVRHSPYRRVSRKYDEMLADEEVALYCSRINSAAPLSQRNNFVDPVAKSLRFGDDEHFIPVSATPSPAAPSRSAQRVEKCAFQGFL